MIVIIIIQLPKKLYYFTKVVWLTNVLVMYFNSFKKIWDRFFVKEWSIGIANCNLDELFNNIDNISFRWLKNEKNEFNADPFIFFDTSKNINLIYENFNYKRQYGIIKLDSYNKYFEKIKSTVFFDNGFHSSYPNFCFLNNQFYFYPENSEKGKLSIFQTDSTSLNFNKLKYLLNIPLLDPTIVFYNNKYWLFGTLRGKNSNKELYIYYSNNFLGPYLSHSLNPVKSTLFNSRPAGNFFYYNNQLLRPSQNCTHSYGEELVINKINLLNEYSFSEEVFKRIKLPASSKYRHGIHTLNISDNVIVIDGLKKIFNPYLQFKYFLYKISK